METYLIIFAAVFVINVIPAFAPPTWAVLVYFAFQDSAHAAAIIIEGVIAAASGRFILAHVFRRISDRLPSQYVQNLTNLGSQLEHHREKAFATAGLFFLSPLSSAQLFEAAGIMRHISLWRVTVAFAAGRTLTYTTYVFGADRFAETDLGAALWNEVSSPRGILFQVLMIVGLVGLGFIHWRPAQASEKPVN